VGQGLRRVVPSDLAETWSKGHDLTIDEAVASGGAEHFAVTFARLRLTAAELAVSRLDAVLEHTLRH
jgi:hypothetical protein